MVWRRWKRRLGTGLAGLAGLALAGCGTVDLFGEYDIPESPDVAAAPWPRLAEVPEAPPRGSYTAAVPDPAVGVMARADLGRVATRAAARAAVLDDPVIDPATRAAMLARARAAR